MENFRPRLDNDPKPNHIESLKIAILQSSLEKLTALVEKVTKSETVRNVLVKYVPGVVVGTAALALSQNIEAIETLPDSYEKDVISNIVFLSAVSFGLVANKTLKGYFKDSYKINQRIATEREKLEKLQSLEKLLQDNEGESLESLDFDFSHIPDWQLEDITVQKVSKAVSDTERKILKYENELDIAEQIGTKGLVPLVVYLVLIAISEDKESLNTVILSTIAPMLVDYLYQETKAKYENR